MIYCPVCHHRIHESDETVVDSNLTYHVTCFYNQEIREVKNDYPELDTYSPSTYKG